MNRFLSATTFSVLSAAIVAAASFAPTDADAGSRRVVHPNAAGGTTGTALVNRQGPNGGSYAAARGVTTDGQGNARAGGAMSASNARGSVQSSGSATRDASGNIDQSRSTTATSASTGNSVQSSSAYNSSTGLTRSATCYNASGAVIACR